MKAVTYEEVIWADIPDRDDAGSPNVVGVMALAAAAEAVQAGRGRNRIREEALVRALDDELATVRGLRRLGSASPDRLPVAAFVIEGMPHGEVAARLARDYGIGVRSGCFCAHPYITRLLALSQSEVERFREDARANRHDRLPGAVRVSCSSATPLADVVALGDALRDITDPAQNRH